MAGNSKDSKMINQLNKTISTQTELIQSLQKTLEADWLEKENLRQQIEYLTKKLFGTSSFLYGV
jgi:transposase